MLYSSPFYKLLQRFPENHIVCEEGSEPLNVGELNEKSIELATYLYSKGVRRGDKAFIAVAPGNEFLIVFLALIHLRVVTALVDPHMGNALYEAKLRQFKPKYAFVDSRLLLLQEHPVLRWIYKKLNPGGFYIPRSNSYTIFSTGRWLPLFQKHFKIHYQKVKSPQFNDASPDEESFVVYTSGTINEPKAVMHTFGSLYESLEGLGALLRDNREQRLATHLPHFALIGLFTGFKTLFWKEELNASGKIEFIKKHKITTLFGPPAEYKPLLEFCKEKNERLPETLKHLLFGSAPVLQSFLKQIEPLTNARLTCFYGMTENLLISSVDGNEKLKSTKEGDLLGKPFKNLETRINEQDELMIKGPYLFSRYFGKEKVEGWFATGDLVRQDDEGNLYMMGREKNMIIRGHKNIYPALYENTIMEIDGVEDALLLGIYQEETFDEAVILVAETDGKITREKLVKALTSGSHAIDSDVLPDHILFMKIPRKGRQQKVDFTTLKDQVKSKLAMT